MVKNLFKRHLFMENYFGVTAITIDITIAYSSTIFEYIFDIFEHYISTFCMHNIYSSMIPKENSAMASNRIRRLKAEHRLGHELNAMYHRLVKVKCCQCLQRKMPSEKNSHQILNSFGNIIFSTTKYVYIVPRIRKFYLLS